MTGSSRICAEKLTKSGHFLDGENTSIEPIDPYNVFFYLWVLACLINTLYAYTWDIKMDWGLADRNAGENTGLREEIVYGSRG